MAKEQLGGLIDVVARFLIFVPIFVLDFAKHHHKPGYKLVGTVNFR